MDDEEILMDKGTRRREGISACIYRAFWLLAGEQDAALFLKDHSQVARRVEVQVRMYGHDT